MRVVITGAAGFIGSHLVDRYLGDGHRVVGVDNFLTGGWENLEGARENPEFTTVQANVAEDWEEILAEFERDGSGVDLVLHFASPASPTDYARHPRETMAANSHGTELCCMAALKYDARLVYASTSEVYGDPQEHPQRESYWGNVNPIGPRACYDESKRFGEALVMSFVRTDDLDARIVRIFNTYGPRMRASDGRAVPNFIFAALRGQPLTVYGDGSQTRSFCYVDDLVEGIVRLAAAPDARGMVVNLGNPGEFTISQLAETVARIAGVPLEIRREPLPPDDPKQRCPDISLARSLLGWQPRIPLEEGLRRSVTSFAATTARLR